MLLQSKFYPTLLYIVFVFFLAFLFAFFNSSAFIKNKKKTKNKNKQKRGVKPTALRLFIGSLYFCSGGTLCALGTMLPSVVGTGTHWLEPTMRMLHVQCMEKKFQFAALLGIVLDL